MSEKGTKVIHKKDGTWSVVFWHAGYPCGTQVYGGKVGIKTLEQAIAFACSNDCPISFHEERKTVNTLRLRLKEATVRQELKELRRLKAKYEGTSP